MRILARKALDFLSLLALVSLPSFAQQPTLSVQVSPPQAPFTVNIADNVYSSYMSMLRTFDKVCNAAITLGYNPPRCNDFLNFTQNPPKRFSSSDDIASPLVVSATQTQTLPIPFTPGQQVSVKFSETSGYFVVYGYYIYDGTYGTYGLINTTTWNGQQNNKIGCPVVANYIYTYDFATNTSTIAPDPKAQTAFQCTVTFRTPDLDPILFNYTVTGQLHFTAQPDKTIPSNFELDITNIQKN